MASALISFVPALPVMAARFELQGGISYMGNPSNGYDTPAAFGELIFDPHPIGSSKFTWSADVTAGWIGSRNNREFTTGRYTTQDDIWLVGGGARIHYGFANAWCRQLFLSFQPAVQSGRTQALSSPYEFITTVGYEGSHWSLGIRHISDGGMHKPNRGETMILAGVAF
nr:lipid A 3-O-deacylase [Dyella soli]